MEGFKTVGDRKYINNLFHTLARQKEIPVSAHIGDRNELCYASLSFDNKHDNEPYMTLEDQTINLHLNEKVKVFFFFKESFFYFEPEIVELVYGAYRLKKPSTLYSASKRMMPRYKFGENETAYLSFSEQPSDYRIYDLSIKGLSFITDTKLTIKGQTIHNITLRLEDHIELLVDIHIKHLRKNNYGKYIYGAAFVTMEWFTSNEIFSYIFEKSYVEIKLLNTLTTAEIFKLYKESRYISVKSKDDRERSFITRLRKLDNCNRNPVLATGAVYFKDGKLMTIGSAFRIYNRSFVGQPFVTVPGVWLNPKGKIDMYIGLAEATINHPYMEYFFSYFTSDLEWHREIFGNIDKIINDKNLFTFDVFPYFEYNISELPANELIEGYYCEKLDNQCEFVNYCNTNSNKLTALECNCYKYLQEGFYLFDLKQFYQEMGFSMDRKLWRISKGSDFVRTRAIAYAVTEVYANGLSIANELDICRVFLADWQERAGADINDILMALLPDVVKFYQRNGKEKFILLFNTQEQISEINIPGVNSVSSLSRIMANREGLVECRKLLLVTSEFLGKYHHLTHPQKLIWYTEKVYPNTSIGNNAGTIRVKGELDFSLLEEALNIFLEKNESIRLRIIEEDNEPRQYISDYNYYFPEIYDFCKSRGFTDFYQWEENTTNIPFELTNSDLFYFAFIRISDQESAFYYKVHHTITDAWAMVLLAHQVFKYYHQLKCGLPILDEKQPSYIEYINSEEEFEHSEKIKRCKKYWDEKYETIPEFIYLKNRRPGNFDTRAKRKGFVIENLISKKAGDFCVARRESVFTLFLSLILIYLNRITMKEDLSIGTTILNRSDVREKKTIGMFVNVTPIRLNVDGNLSFESYVQTVVSEWKLFLKYQKYPYDLILKDFREKHKVQDELYDVTFTHQNAKWGIDEYIGDYKGRWHTYGYQSNSLNIFLNDREDEGNYILNFDYLVEFFTDEEIERMYNHLLNLLQDAIENPGKKLYQLEMLSETEKKRILSDFNDTNTVFPKDKTINQLFEEQVEKTPDNIAVVSDDKQLSYRELNQKSNQLARILRVQGVKPDTIVGIMVERSLEMMIGIMGILKAGGAYVPIDPEYPEKRINYILNDSGANNLLSQSRYFSRVKDFNGNIIDLEDRVLYQGDNSNMDFPNKFSNLAYVIYTSGSTGNPKGVMIEHKSVINLTAGLWEVIYKRYGEYLNVALVAPYFFDASVQQIFPSVLLGHKLFIVPENTRVDGSKLLHYLNSNSIFISDGTPTHIKLLTNAMPLTVKDLTVKHFIIGGEELPYKTVKNFYERFSNETILITNVYGPTECCVDSTYYTIDAGILKKTAQIPIGSPMPNYKAYILGKNLEPVPAGAIGEIYISGEGAGRGYLNKPELSREKFTAGIIQNERIYRTGDLGRWMPDGNIEFLGRVDYQVKIRGYRIELGEIERQLLNYRSLKEVVVIARDDNNNTKYLCAYFVSDKKPAVSELRNHLLKDLPDYMVPSFFIQLVKIPLTMNGKIDRNALPAPDMKQFYAEYEAPTNDIEEKMAGVWQKVLNVKKVGISNNFFELGGDSIKAIEVSAGLHNYGLIVELRDYFRYPTIKEQSKVVRLKNSTKISQAPVVGEICLTPIQEWFFEQNFTNMHYFNQLVILHRENGFDEAIVGKVFDKIAGYHDALRIVYRNINGDLLQINRGLEVKLFDLMVFDISKDKNAWDMVLEKTDRLQSCIDLNDGPLIKLGLFKTAAGDYLSIIIHHLVIDGVSWRIILEDFSEGYSQALRFEDVKFPEKTSSYKEWAEKLRVYAQDKNLLRELRFWEKIKNTPVHPLPKDNHITENRVMDGRDLQLTLTQVDTKNLIININKAFNTNIYETLLTVLGLTLKNWTGENSFIIDLEGHGRENIVEGIDLSRTVGWFTSLFPFVMDMTYSLDLSYQIRFIKESIRHIPNRGIGYGILKYLTSKTNDIVSKLPSQSEVCFNYLGQFNDVKNEVFTVSQFLSTTMVSPEAHRRYALDINAIIINDILTINFNYNKNEYHEATVAEFIGLYRNNLAEIMKYCSSQVFTKLSPTDFGEMNLEINELDRITEIYGKKIERIYGLTPLQEGILFHSIMNMGSTVYFEQIALNLLGELEVELLEKSLNYNIERYEVLRTVFCHQNIKNPKQVVLKEQNSTIHFEDITYISETEKDLYVENFERRDREKGFHLSKDLPVRLSVLRRGVKSYRIILSFHHIILDGWSLSIIFKELFEIYQSFLDNRKLDLPMIRPFGDYVRWLEKTDQEDALNYWRNYLEQYTTPTGIPKKRNSVLNDNFELKELEFKLSEALTGDLIKIAQTGQVTLNTLFSAVWGLLLSRYNNVDKAAFGTVVSVRPAEIQGIQNIAGLFINTIPTLIRIKESCTFVEFIKQTQQNMLSSEKYSYYPLSLIQQNTQLKQELLDHIIAFENYPLEDEMKNLLYESKFLKFKISDLMVFEHTNYNLNILVIPGKELLIRFNYNAYVFDEYIIKNIEKHIYAIINTIIENPDVTIKGIQILSPEEKRLILDEFNDTMIDYPGNKTIQELFEEQVRKSPEEIAVVFEDQCITYKKLNERSNQLASVLRQKGIGKNSVVGLMAKQSIETTVGILGILKTGGAYLPIDHRYPAERVEYILRDSASSILLTQRLLLKQLDNFYGEVLDLEDETLYQATGHNIENINQPEDLAYIMYTSGSTGKPKGVMVVHQGVARLVKNPSYISFENNDRILQIGSISFDASTFELWGALLNGLRLYLIKEDTKLNVEELQDAIIKNQISILLLTTPFFNLIANQKPGLFASLKYLLVGGDALSPKYINLVQSKSPALKIINVYGPTENTTFSTCFLIDKFYDDNIPIGQPVSNSTAYVVDKHYNLLPVGIPGELCVGGDGLAKGYLNNAELTKEKFIPNPFKEGELLYRTGDLARWLPDGTVEFLGRIDNQVKIRGFRMELGEIETHLSKHEKIKAVTVIDKKDSCGEKYLCAYFVSDHELIIPELRRFLSETLPEYMIPSHFVKIDVMPLNANGKVDRSALPEPNQEITIRNKENEKPVRVVEQKLAVLWQKVLECGDIGIYDNFFEIGGNSFAIMRVVSEAFPHGWNLSIQDFYEYPTIKELADKILGLTGVKKDLKSTTSDIVDTSTRHDPSKIFVDQKTGQFKNVLLTGATGFLGIHILDKLISETNTNIYCLIRSENQTIAKDKLTGLLKFYFADKYDDAVFDRVFIVNGDLTYDKFGLSKSDYSKLSSLVDTVIHAAALVKHYGKYSDFEKINVLGTQEIIKFSVINGSKLNHISTISVSGDTLKQSKEGMEFTENDFYIGQNYSDSVYVKSKFEAENLIFKATSEGLSTTIFRVGNLTERYSDGQFQREITENKFHNRMKAIIDLRIVPDIILEEYIELTPVDFCSNAIIKLIQSKNNSRNVFHIYNHKMIKLIDLFEIFSKMDINIEIQRNSSYKKYIDFILVNNNKKADAVSTMINEFNVDELFNPQYRVKITSDITCEYLKQLGFDWPEIDYGYLEKIINYMQKVGYLVLDQKISIF